MVRLKGDPEIGDKINKIIGRLAEANDLKGVIDVADFNDEAKLGREMVDRLSRLIGIFEGIDLRANRAEGDDLLGDAYEYLMRNFATESGKSKGQFYTPAEVSQVMAQPDEREQRAIAAVLSDMDAAIAALARQRDKVQALKQGMMAELLTGRVRLVESLPAQYNDDNSTGEEKRL